MKSIEEKKVDLLKSLDVKKLRELTKKNNILLQMLLQELVVTYTIDIKEQVKQKQEDIISTYPTDLINSLKVLNDLHSKIRDQNKTLRITEDKKQSHHIDYVF